jgi:hypothetical protein
MPELPDELMNQLLELIDRLRVETAGYLDEPGDQQTWYNRGYANGMVLALGRLGQTERVGRREPDNMDKLSGQMAMPWGKAYRHGEAVGSRETEQLKGNQST